MMSTITPYKFYDIIEEDNTIHEHIPQDLIEENNVNIDDKVKFTLGYNDIRNEYRQECIFRIAAIGELIL